MSILMKGKKHGLLKSWLNTYNRTGLYFCRHIWMLVILNRVTSSFRLYNLITREIQSAKLKLNFTLKKKRIFNIHVPPVLHEIYLHWRRWAIYLKLISNWEFWFLCFSQIWQPYISTTMLGKPNLREARRRSSFGTPHPLNHPTIPISQGQL